MLLFILLALIAAAASSGLPATKTATLSNSPRAPLLDQSDTNITSPSYLTIHENVMKIGSSCYGLEGEWNCMTTTFQRCASGQWSVVMDTALGTVCEPVGFTYDLQPAFASWFPTTDTTQTITCVATATVTGGPTHSTARGTSDAPLTDKAARKAAICVLVFVLATTTSMLLEM